jgi:aminopeptidase N
MWTQFVNGDRAEALALDALNTSHPISQEVEDPDKISEVFDDIAYSKGASGIKLYHTMLQI